MTFAINRISRGDDAHREIEDNLPDPRLEYFKFLQVRHPLERLASAYYSRCTHVQQSEPHMEEIRVSFVNGFQNITIMSQTTANRIMQCTTKHNAMYYQA